MWLSALTSSEGGNWFGFDAADQAWSVTTDSPESQKVADYWQDLVDNDLVVPTIVLSASMIRQANAISRVQSVLQAQSHTIATPTIIDGGPIITATSQATAASLVTSILNPAS